MELIVYQRLEQLFIALKEKHGISKKGELLDRIGLNASTLSQGKTRGTYPSFDVYEKLLLFDSSINLGWVVIGLEPILYSDKKEVKTEDLENLRDMVLELKKEVEVIKRRKS